MARRTVSLVLLFGLLGFTAIQLRLFAEEPPAKPDAAKPAETKPAEAKRPDPQPIGEAAKKGISYVVGQQNADGGWGQGGGWRTGGQGGGRVEGAEVKDPSDVGNTCVAVLALIRSGSTPVAGEYASQVGKGIDFICKHIEAADRQSIWVTDVRDTQLQSKIGQYVDTFLAALVLSELKGKVPADKGGSRIEESLKKVIAKIESNQKEDGTFAGNHGWASVLSQGLASKALNRAVQNGVQVKGEVLKRDFAQAQQSIAAAKGGDVGGLAAAATATAVAEPVAGPVKGRPADVAAAAKTARISVSGVGGVGGGAAAADAGVKIYNFSANAGRFADLANSQAGERKKAQAVLESKTATPGEKETAKKQVDEFAQVAQAQTEAVDDLVKRLDDKQFIAGFGNNGGEEFLSYMNLSETMLVKGGDEWNRWNKSIGEVIGKAQNGDGSWSGQHCITGRTFCTSAALLTLMADRAPIPVAEKIAEAKK